MTKKRRQSLDDALAAQFVYGKDQPSEDNQKETLQKPEDEGDQPASPSPVVPSKTNTNKSLMDKLQIESKEATKRFTVDLPETMHRKLSIVAARTGRSKADIVRMLLNDALEEVEE